MPTNYLDTLTREDLIKVIAHLSFEVDNYRIASNDDIRILDVVSNVAVDRCIENKDFRLPSLETGGTFNATAEFMKEFSLLKNS